MLPSAPNEPAPEPRRAGALSPTFALIAAMRPKQWTKNLFVFIALVFTNSLPTSVQDSGHLRALGLTCLAFALFCLISGAIYLLNDAFDREQDRLHPEKRKRPIASGRLSVGFALAGAALFGPGGVAASFLINRGFGLIALLYLVLQVAYTLSLKHMVLIDVFVLAGGFVLRAVAGGFAIHVPISEWLLVCTLQLALFMGFGKRRHELVSLAEEARNHRRNLAQYTVPLLDQLIAIVLGALTVCYAIYVILSPTALKHPALVMTLPSVMYGIFRYLYLIHVEHKGGSPETILLQDRPMQLNLLLWVALVIVAFKVPVHGIRY